MNQNLPDQCPICDEPLFLRATGRWTRLVTHLDSRHRSVAQSLVPVGAWDTISAAKELRRLHEAGELEERIYLALLAR